MSDLAYGVGLVLILEGLVFSLFPAQMKSYMRLVLEESDNVLRYGGLTVFFSGMFIVWLIKG